MVPFSSTIIPICITFIIGLHLSSLVSAHPVNKTQVIYRRAASREEILSQLPKPFKQTIVGIGDLHGDYDAMEEVLLMTGVAKDVKEGGEIVFNDDPSITVVQVGDIMDRGAQPKAIFKVFDDLRKAWGKDRILNLLGNHEVINIYGDWRFVSEDEINSYRGKVNDDGEFQYSEEEGIQRRMMMLRKGWIGKTLREDYLVAARVPLHPALGPVNTVYRPEEDPNFGELSHATIGFIHGGISDGTVWSDFPRSLNNFGSEVIKQLQAQKIEPRMKGSIPPKPPKFSGNINNRDAMNFILDGVLWNRDWAERPDSEKLCQDIDYVLQKHGLRHLVMGHTINQGGIVSRCDGKILLIDTGMSYGFGWERGMLSAIKFDYSWKPLDEPFTFEEQSTVTAIYQYKSPVKLTDDTPRIIKYIVEP
ncbi:hypothetical protein FRB99_000053 [Tulasnella sp. 403]|nr:hypothetical protein FRB99_000053 [Tulasnella sp. 403]